MDARSPNGRVTADRPNFWKVVNRTNPSKLSLFSENELRDCQDYFSKAQSDPAAPPNELIMAAERLTLIRSEIDGRHGDANYRRAQRLARWAIGLAVISLTAAIAFGIALFLPKQPTRENWSAGQQTLPVSAAVAVDLPSPTPKTAEQPSATPDVTVAPVYAIAEQISTPTATAKSRPRSRHRGQRQRVRKPDSHLRVEDFFRSLFRRKPTPTPSAVRRR
jgi:hypothetical protein